LVPPQLFVLCDVCPGRRPTAKSTSVVQPKLPCLQQRPCSQATALSCCQSTACSGSSWTGATHQQQTHSLLLLRASKEGGWRASLLWLQPGKEPQTRQSGTPPQGNLAQRKASRRRQKHPAAPAPTAAAAPADPQAAPTAAAAAASMLPRHCCQPSLPRVFQPPSLLLLLLLLPAKGLAAAAYFFLGAALVAGAAAGWAAAGCCSRCTPCITQDSRHTDTAHGNSFSMIAPLSSRYRQACQQATHASVHRARE
jgi:hypothetical protein